MDEDYQDFSEKGKSYIKRTGQENPAMGDGVVVEACIMLPAAFYYDSENEDEPGDETGFSLVPELCFGDSVVIAGEPLTHAWGLPSALDGEFLEIGLPEKQRYRQRCAYFSASSWENAELLAEIWLTRESLVFNDAILSRG